MFQWLQVQTLGVEGGCGYLMEYGKLCSHTALKFMVTLFPHTASDYKLDNEKTGNEAKLMVL